VLCLLSRVYLRLDWGDVSTVLAVVNRNSFQLSALLPSLQSRALVVEALAADLYSDSTEVLHPSNSQLQLSLLLPPAPTPTALVK